MFERRNACELDDLEIYTLRTANMCDIWGLCLQATTLVFTAD